jgi:hypothetical protein
MRRPTADNPRAKTPSENTKFETKAETEEIPMVDFSARNHLSLVILSPHTAAARDWAADHFSGDTPCWAGGVVIESRCFDEVANAIRADGLTLHLDAMEEKALHRPSRRGRRVLAPTKAEEQMLELAAEKDGRTLSDWISKLAGAAPNGRGSENEDLGGLARRETGMSTEA